MKAVILCGGQGTRLREKTETIPKPMVRIGGKPILWHILRTYAHYDITDFILCLGYKGDVIKDYFRNFLAANNDFTVTLGEQSSIQIDLQSFPEANWTVTLADTGENSMTGSRVKQIQKYLHGEDTFLLTYGDGLCDVNVEETLAFHKRGGQLLTVTGVRPPSRYGEIISDETDTVVSFAEKPQVGTSMINGGYFVCDASFLNYLSDDPSCILERGPMEQCAKDKQMKAFEHQGFWQCMDTFREWQYLETMWQSKQAPWMVWT
jgi:glucose-1-phosphate cytidylyltransferase